ncbi:MAG TPA: VWA domain-containing protein [Nitrospira sp.]|nr:VWA domain-containing protein [Nitrospira sp.]
MADQPGTLVVVRLAAQLGEADAAVLSSRICASGIDPAAVVFLLDELRDLSSRAVDAAIATLPELDRRGVLEQTVPWLDLAVALAHSSGAVALKYFKDSPLVLGLIASPDLRGEVLRLGLELAEHDANVALEYVRHAPQIVSVLDPRAMDAWLDIGLDVTRTNAVVGLEYIRQIPNLVPVLPIDAVRSWLDLGITLITPNALGKPDYIATIEFLRTGPTLLAEIEGMALRSKVLALVCLLVEQSKDAGLSWFAEAPRLLRAMPSAEWRMKVLQYGLLLGERDAAACLSYLRRCPELLALIGEGPQGATKFERWFQAGMEVLAYSIEGARAYFSVASHTALLSVEEALSGVPLRQVSRRIKLFVEGLCGADVSIAPLPESYTDGTVSATVSADGRTMALPAVIRRYPHAEDNERLYLVMAAHEAGHWEFGTYRLAIDRLSDMVSSVRERYGKPETEPLDSLASLFRLYPHPRLVQDLWTLLEDARVEFLLQQEYPGLRSDLARLAAEALRPRDPAQGLTAKELIVDCLLRLTVGRSEQAIPDSVREEVAVLWDLCRPVFQQTATAEDAVRCAHRVYVTMEELLAPKAEMLTTKEPDTDPEERQAAPEASVTTGEDYRPVSSWGPHRGVMNPAWIGHEGMEQEAPEGEQEPASRTARDKDGSIEGSGPASGARQSEQSASHDLPTGGRSLPSLVEELMAINVDQTPLKSRSAEAERAVLYPEWDDTIRDYRTHWCRVVERRGESGSDEPVSATLTRHRSAIRLLRRFFESLRPPSFRRVPGQIDGDELDMEALVRHATDLRAGLESDERLYVRREKKERDVAAAVLVDVSGSTSRQIESGRRVLDVEQESLVLLCEALEAVGDQYALYAYSGEGRDAVDFLVVKEFEERLGRATAHRLGGLAPRRQNRDGAAIRHATAKLLRRDVKTRLLVLLSDGRPLDDEYKDEYALADTKVALEEARRRGVHPFCVTVDREADAYLRRMYGDVRYTVIDRVEALPARLPRLYRRLTT